MPSMMPEAWDGKDTRASYQQAFGSSGIAVGEVGPDRSPIRRVDLGGAK